MNYLYDDFLIEDLYPGQRELCQTAIKPGSPESLYRLSLIASKRNKKFSVYLPKKIANQVSDLKRCCFSLFNLSEENIVLAARYGHLHCLKFFLKRITPCQFAQKRITTAALQHRHFQILNYLIDLNFAFDTNYVNIIIKHGHFKLLQLLADKNVDCFNTSSINRAICYNRVQCLELLLTCTNIPITSRMAALSIQIGYLRCFELFLEENVTLSEECLINAINFSGPPILWVRSACGSNNNRKEYSILKQRRQLVNVLLEYEVSIGPTSLHEAIRSNDDTIYKALINSISQKPTIYESMFIEFKTLKLIVDTRVVNLEDLRDFILVEVALTTANYVINKDDVFFLKELYKYDLIPAENLKILFLKAVSNNSAKCIDFFVKISNSSWVEWITQQKLLTSKKNVYNYFDATKILLGKWKTPSGY